MKLYIIVKHCFQPIIKRHNLQRLAARQLQKKQQQQQQQQQQQPMGRAQDSATAAASADGNADDEVVDVPEPGPLELWLMAEDRRYLWVWAINALGDFLHRK